MKARYNQWSFPIFYSLSAWSFFIFDLFYINEPKWPHEPKRRFSNNVWPIHTATRGHYLFLFDFISLSFSFFPPPFRSVHSSLVSCRCRYESASSLSRVLSLVYSSCPSTSPSPSPTVTSFHNAFLYNRNVLCLKRSKKESWRGHQYIIRQRWTK